MELAEQASKSSKGKPMSAELSSTLDILSEMIATANDETPKVQDEKPEKNGKRKFLDIEDEKQGKNKALKTDSEEEERLRMQEVD